MALAPTLEQDRKTYGVRIDRQEFPVGVAGVRLSLSEIARRIREGGRTPSIRAFAENVVRQTIPPSQATSSRQAAAALLEYVIQNVRYRPDVPLTEWVQGAAITLCVNGAPMCIPIGDCFPEGTLLLRDDYELVPIEKIKIGDQIRGRDKWSAVEGKAFKGALKVDAVTMNNGSTVYLTPDHKVYVGSCKHGKRAECPTCKRSPSLRRESFDRVRVSDLKIGDSLLQPDRIAFGSEQTDPDIEYVDGLYISEGWCDERRFSISGQDGSRKEALKREVAEICDARGINTRRARKYIAVNDKAWATRLAALGTRARFKRMRTMNLAPASAAALLRGVMSDSTQNTNGPGRTFSTTSHTLMVQMRVMQRMHGRSTGVKFLTPEQHGGAGEHPLWRLGVRVIDKGLAVKSISRGVRKVACWDIQTDDHYVYLPEHDVTVSNCDDLVVALGSLLMSYGIPVRVVKQTFGVNDQEHVLIEFQDEGGSWIAADPTPRSPSLQIGQRAVASHEDYIDPLDPSQIGMVAGTPEAEFIGVGSLPDSYERMEVRDMGYVNGVLEERAHGKTWQRIGDTWIEKQEAGFGATRAAVPSTLSHAGRDRPREHGERRDRRRRRVRRRQSAGVRGGRDAYKAAGDAGVTMVGPGIASAGLRRDCASPTSSRPPRPTSSSRASRPRRRRQPTPHPLAAYAKQIANYYTSAIAAGRLALNTTSPTYARPQPPAMSLGQAVTTAAGLGVAAGLIYYISKG